MNSQGSAQNELNTYLDSVEGKMAQLQNSLQQLATVTIDSEWLKDIIELGTSAVKVVTQLVDAFGGLSGILGAGIGGFLQFTGNGLFRKNGMGDWELGRIIKDQMTKFTNGYDASGSIATAFRSIFTANSQRGKDAIKYLQTLIPTGSQDVLFKDAIGWDTVSPLGGSLKNATEDVRDLLTNMRGLNVETASVTEMISKIGKSTTLLGGVGGFLGNAVTSIASFAATAGLSMLVTGVVSGLFNIIDNKIHERENKIKKGEEALTESREIREQTDNINKVGTKAKDRYNELRSGVYMNGNQIKNLSLSTEDYEEFLAINQQLADTFPSLKTGVTDSGQSLVDLGKNAQQATDSLNALIEAQNRMNANALKERMPDIIGNIEETNKTLDEEIQEQQNAIDTYKRLLAQAQQPIETGRQSEGNIFNFKGQEDAENAFISMMEEAGLEYSKIYDVTGVIEVNKDNISKVQDVYTAFQNDLADRINATQSTVDALNKSKQSNWISKFLPNFMDMLETDPAYLRMPEQIQSGIETMLNSIDFNYDALFDQLGGGDNFDEKLKNRIIAPIERSLQNGDVDTIDMQKIFDFDFDNATNEEMRQQINETLNEIFPGGEGTEDYEIKQWILVSLGYKYEDENGNTHWNHTDTRAAIFEALGGEVTQGADGKNVYKQGKSKISWDDIKTLDQEEQRIAQTAMKNQNFNFVGNTIEALREYLNQLSQIKEEAGTGTLADILNDEDFSNSASQYESNLSSLNNALESYRENGKLTAEEMKNLQDAMPSMDDFSFEGINNAAVKQLSEYIKEFKKVQADKGPLTPEATRASQAYIDNLIESYDNLSVSAETAKNSLKETFSYTDQTGSHLNEQKYNDVLTALSQNGEELDYNVLWELTLDGTITAESTLQQILAEYNHKKIEWDLIIKDREAEAVLEKNEQKRNLINARNENRQAKGERLTEEELNNSVMPLYESDIQAYHDKANTALGRMNKAADRRDQVAYDKALADYREALANISSTETEMIETRKENAQTDLNNLKTDYATSKANGDQLQKERTDIENRGEYISHNLAKLQANNAKEQIGIQESIMATALGLAQRYGNPDSDVYDLEKSASMYQEALDAGEVISGLQKYTSPMYNEAESHLNVLQNEMTNIQDQASAINDEITVNQAKGIKANEKEYKNLATLSRQQAKNLSDQNRALRNQLPALRNNKQEYQDTLNQIRQNESSMAQALADAYGYDDQAHNLLLTQAQDLSSAIQSAFSEMATPTGITPDTIKAISTAFSDLGSSADLSSVFYNTTDGVKANVVELQRLAQQEYELSNNDLTTKINQTTEALNRMENASGDINTAGINKLKQDLADLQQQQSQVFAAYQQLMEQFSQHGQIALADQTVNQGANYDKAMNYLKEAKEMWDKGLIGTDDYKTRAAYFDEWGLSDPTRFKQNYDKFSKYMTDDIQGVHKFMMDLQSAGMATFETYEDGTQGLVMNFTDLAKAAHQFGAGEEWFRDMFGKAEEYGGMGAFVSSMEDAQLQTQKWTNELTNAQLKYAEMKREGASADDLALQQDVIDQYQGQLNAVQTATQNFQRGQAQEYVSNLKNLKSSIADLKSYYDDAMERGDEASANRFLREAQDLADDYGIKVNADFEVDEASYESAMKDLEGKIGSWESPLGAEAFGIDRNTAEFSAFEAGKTKIQNAKDAVMEYADALKGIPYDDLKKIKLGDGNYNVEGLHEAEDALEAIATAAGLSSAQAEQLVPILAALGVIDFAGAINSMNQFSDSTTVATDKVEALFKGTKYEGATQFDAATMSVDELQNKLAEISEMKAQINVEEEGGQEAMDQLNQLEAKTKQEYQIKLSVQQMSDRDINDFLNADYETQIDIMANMGYAESDYESFVAMVEAQQVEAPIKVKLDESSLQGINEAVRAAIEGKDYSVDVHGEYQGTRNEPKEIVVPVRQQLVQSTYGGLTDGLLGGGPVSNILHNLEGQGFTVTPSVDTEPVVSGLEEATSGTDYNVIPAMDYKPIEEGLDKVTGKERVIQLREQIIEPKGNKSSAPKTRKVVENVETKQSGGGMDGILKSITTLKSQMSNLPQLNINTGNAQSELLKIYASYLRLKQNVAEPIELKVSGDSIVVAIRQIMEGFETLRSQGEEPIELIVNTDSAIESVNSLQDAIEEVKSAASDSIEVSANVDGKSDVDALRKAIEQTHGKEIPISVSGVGNSMLEVRKLGQVIQGIAGKNVNIGVSVGNALLSVHKLKQEIAGITGKTVTITTVRQTVQQTVGKKVYGTLSSIGHGYAKGTFDEDGKVAKSGSAYNMLNYKDMSGYARGDVAIKEDQESLVNELGMESLIIFFVKIYGDI